MAFVTEVGGEDWSLLLLVHFYWFEQPGGNLPASGGILGRLNMNYRWDTFFLVDKMTSFFGALLSHRRAQMASFYMFLYCRLISQGAGNFFLAILKSTIVPNRACRQFCRQWMASSQVASRKISTVAASLQELHPDVVPNEQTIDAEPVDVPIPRTQLLVLGGNGFVGSHVCKEALERGLPVLSLSRSGKPSVHEPWMNDVNWIRGSLFQTDKWKTHLKEVTAVVSCVGGFGSNAEMRKINGDANISAINVSAESGVQRFVYVSAADFNLPSFVLKGYYDGKKAAEEVLRSKFPYGGVILRPSFIHGTRRVGSVNIPLSAIGAPLELLFRNMKPASQIPIVGPLLVPPVKVNAVAKAAVRAAVDNAVPPGMLDVWGIIRLGDRP